MNATTEGANASDPDVTVVIATYNRVEGLKRLLSCLAAQEGVLGRFDAVVVDDGSAEAIELPRHLPFPLQVIRQDNAGPSVARDVGIRATRGAIVVIVDDDMVVPAGFVSAHQRAHEDGADVVLGHIRAPQDGMALPLFERFHQDSLDRFVVAVHEGRAVVDGTRLCSGNASFSRTAYERVGGFDRSLRRCEDRDLGVRFEAAGYRLVFSKEAWADHRSDHEDVATWRRRSALYGSLDVGIASKHPTRASVSPWAFLPKLPAVARPLVVAAALEPAVGRSAAAVAYRLAAIVDRVDSGPLAAPAGRVALTGASLCYGCDYYSGVGRALREASGGESGVKAVLRSLRAHRRIVRHRTIPAARSATSCPARPSAATPSSATPPSAQTS